MDSMILLASRLHCTVHELSEALDETGIRLVSDRDARWLTLRKDATGEAVQLPVEELNELWVTGCHGMRFTRSLWADDDSLELPMEYPGDQPIIGRLCVLYYRHDESDGWAVIRPVSEKQKTGDATRFPLVTADGVRFESLDWEFRGTVDDDWMEKEGKADGAW
ncbi:hypothetical protein [Bifidobacterium sp. SO1]|uniref:hypothetical protein n=1 Tax=Bifidobacterium sp. SO1 TaxID=2809029 RepID=UPI001BDC4059|nr:hypothetical protein [Bifidobacterium sp. SO1]MBT1162127.1 hypothetical protein [Bifidobacterium sp. SO1]